MTGRQNELKLVALLVIGWVLLAMRSASLGATADASSDNFADRATGAVGLDAIGKAAMTVRLAAPLTTFREGGGIALGNGWTGGLLHGQGSHLQIWLDRADFGDERPCPTILEKDFNYRHWVELKNAANWKELNRLFDLPWRYPTPTKLPGGQLDLTLDDSQQTAAFVLDLEQAVARVEDADGKTLAECFYSAVDGVAVMRVTGSTPPRCALAVPPLLQEKMGYAPPQIGADDKGDVSWFVQQVPEAMTYAVTTGQRRLPDSTLIVWAMTASTTDGADPLRAGQERVRSALAKGFEALLQPHAQWWRQYWSVSQIRLPDEVQQRHYNLVRYLLGSGSRQGCPAMGGKGLWSDGMKLPVFKWGYHGDLTVQANYGSYLAAGHFREGTVFVEHMWDRLPVWRKFAHDFYDAPGAMIPGVMSQAGVAETGSPAYALMPQGDGAWYGWLFYRHWLYTCDAGFLRERAYPFCSELGQCIASLLHPDSEGHLHVQLSSSPELGDNHPPACYLPPNSNYDQAGMLALFGALARMADELHRADDAAHWRQMVAGLGGLWVDPQTGALGFAPGMPFNESHRHHSHLMAIYPYGTLNVEGSAEDRRMIAASMRLLDQFGTANWKNADPWDASFAWAACLKARVGDGQGALDELNAAYYRGLNRSGLSFDGNILEGNFLAMAAVQEMLLQCLGGVIRVFPAIPRQWPDVEFRDLRAEGAFRISAVRKAGHTLWVRVESDAGKPCRIRTGLPGAIKVRDGTVRDLGDGTVQLDLPAGSAALLYSGDIPPAAGGGN